ncbi:hypothetical protein BC828DRAFT_395296 [Blastocladiella britannica]|nr:hypothetical protein BC828DRAFT_395296 [Blastocladiella britannica]
MTLYGDTLMSQAWTRRYFQRSSLQHTRYSLFSRIIATGAATQKEFKLANLFGYRAAVRDHIPAERKRRNRRTPATITATATNLTTEQGPGDQAVRNTEASTPAEYAPNSVEWCQEQALEYSKCLERAPTVQGIPISDLEDDVLVTYFRDILAHALAMAKLEFPVVMDHLDAILPMVFSPAASCMYLFNSIARVTATGVGAPVHVFPLAATFKEARDEGNMMKPELVPTNAEFMPDSPAFAVRERLIEAGVMQRKPRKDDMDLERQLLAVFNGYAGFTVAYHGEPVTVAGPLTPAVVAVRAVDAGALAPVAAPPVPILLAAPAPAPAHGHVALSSALAALTLEMKEEMAAMSANASPEIARVFAALTALAPVVPVVNIHCVMGVGVCSNSSGSSSSSSSSGGGGGNGGSLASLSPSRLTILLSQPTGQPEPSRPQHSPRYSPFLLTTPRSHRTHSPENSTVA